MCSCDFEYPKISSVIIRRAKKGHQCSECLNPIAVGETYRIDKGCLDSSWYESKCCDRCETIAWWAKRESTDFCFYLGGLHDSFGESDFATWDSEEETYRDLPEGIDYLEQSFIPQPYLCTVRHIVEQLEHQKRRNYALELNQQHLSTKIDRLVQGVR